MKVRWGSTYAMLNRAETKREVSQLPLTLEYNIAQAHALLQCCDEFVFALRRKETSAEKRRKLGDLALSEEEWNQVRLFCNLLQVIYISIRSSHHRILPLASACGHCTAGIFSGCTTNSSQCPSRNWKNVQHLAEGIGETTLPYFQACARSSYGQVGWVLQENRWVGCTYYCNGYVYQV